MSRLSLLGVTFFAMTSRAAFGADAPPPTSVGEVFPVGTASTEAPPVGSPPVSYSSMPNPALQRRNAGMMITTAGVALSIPASLLMTIGMVSGLSCLVASPLCTERNFDYFKIGAIMGAVSLPLVVIGVPLWVSGNRELRYTSAPRGVLGFRATPQGTYTLSLSGRF